MCGEIVYNEVGDCACPQLTFVRLERDGVLIFEGWED
jgi:hypothetical protein